MTGNRVQIAVRQLRSAMERAGTDEQAVWDALSGLFADERAMVSHRYRDSYGITLLQHIAQEFSNSSVFGNELQKTLELWSHGGLSVAQRIYFAVQAWGTDDPALQAALAEIRNLTPAEVEALRTLYAALSGGETLDNAILNDLGGRDRLRAEQALRGVPNGILGESLRMIEEHDYEITGWTNYVGTYYVSVLNDSYSNEQRAFQNLQAAHQAYATNQTPANETALRQAMSEFRQHMQSFQEARDAVSELTANSLATAAGILVVVGSGGVATPLVVALAAGAGGATQALTRLGLDPNSFTLEQVATDFVLGAINAGTAALSFPALTAAQIEAGVTVNIIRRVAGSAFVGGASASGVATALTDGNWQNGIAVGVVNIAQASLIGGFASTALPATIGAGVVFARRALPFTRTVMTTTGTAVTNIFDPAWVRTGSEAIRNGTQNVRQYLVSTLTGWANKADELAGLIRAWAADEPESVLRQRVVAALEATGWGENRIRLALEVVVDTANANQASLGSLSNEAARELVEGRVQVFMMSMSDAVESLKTRVGITDDAVANSLANRLGSLQNATDAELDAALRAELGAGTNVTREMVRTARDWINSPSGLDSGLPGRGVWDIAGIRPRGFRVEEILGGRTGLHDDFPVIDQWQNGIATSIKSLDLAMPTYVTRPRSFWGVYQDYIDELFEFARTNPVTNDGITISPSQIVQRELVIAIPPHVMSVAQREVLQQIVDYGAGRNIVVRIVELR